jgi:2-deoxy-D-gluconate 3-dehydrogenase
VLAQFDLTGKVALVTGGTRGIGRALAEGLGAAGASVTLIGRRRDSVDEAVSALRARGVKATGIPWDVQEHEAAEDVVRAVVAEWGRLDILVNNAGMIERHPAVDYPLDSWNRVLATNLTSVMALSKASGRAMISQGGGRIVNIASVLAFSGGKNVVAYAVSKGGLVQLTRALAVEWACHGVTVNAIAAGYVHTDLTSALRGDPDRERELLSRIPLGRWGAPSDLIGATIFLGSDGASYVTGSVLAVDGGWTAA